MKYAAIIPNRGSERKLFVEWQRTRAMDLGYDRVYVVDYEPLDDKVDIYNRLVVGAAYAQEDGMDYCSIIESDDFYQLDYLDTIKARMVNEPVLFGINQTMYYHLFSCGWKRMSHPGRSSLFCTTFKVSAFNDLPAVDGDPFVDLKWWAHVNKTNMNYQLINDDLAVGIKHGSVFGKVGGHGHFIPYAHYDTRLVLLKQLMDADAFEFFSGVKHMFQKNWEQGIKLQ